MKRPCRSKGSDDEHMKQQVRDSDATIYSVILVDPVLDDGNPGLLKRLSAETGGEAHALLGMAVEQLPLGLVGLAVLALDDQSARHHRFVAVVRNGGFEAAPAGRLLLALGRPAVKGAVARAQGPERLAERGLAATHEAVHHFCVTDSGETAVNGNYRFEIEARAGNDTIEATPLSIGRVDGVLPNQDELTFNIGGMSPTRLSEIRQFL